MTDCTRSEPPRSFGTIERSVLYATNVEKESVGNRLASLPLLTLLHLLVSVPSLYYLTQSRLSRHVVTYLEVKEIGSLQHNMDCLCRVLTVSSLADIIYECSRR